MAGIVTVTNWPGQKENAGEHGHVLTVGLSLGIVVICTTCNGSSPMGAPHYGIGRDPITLVESSGNRPDSTGIIFYRGSNVDSRSPGHHHLNHITGRGYPTTSDDRDPA